LPCNLTLIARALIKCNNSRTLVTETAIETLRAFIESHMDLPTRVETYGQTVTFRVGYGTSATMTATGINIASQDRGDVTKLKAALEPLAIKIALSLQNAAIVKAVQARYAGVTVATSGSKTLVTIPL
jgi:hypothetical protein